MDGAGLVFDRASGRARQADSVGAVESRCDVNSCVVGHFLSSEDTHDEREEEDDDVLEGAHGD